MTSLRAQNFPGLEIIVVDNASTDGTPQWLRAEFPWVTLIHQGCNAGYGRAANTGIKAARAEAVMVANPDTLFREGSLEQLTAALTRHPRAFINPKLVLPDGRVNALGNIMHISGITSCHQYGKPCKSFAGILPIPLLSGAAVLAARDVWVQLRGFDPHIFLYMEDAELSLRARLLGLELYCAADAEVVHDYSLKLTPAKFQWLEQHRLWTVLKLYSWSTLLRLSPALLLAGGLTWLFALLRGGAYLGARLRASLWVWRHMGQLFEARQGFHGLKQTPDQSIIGALSPELPTRQLVVRTSHMASHLSHMATTAFRLLQPGTKSHTAIHESYRSGG